SRNTESTGVDTEDFPGVAADVCFEARFATLPTLPVGTTLGITGPQRELVVVVTD
ncbi:hypothetical protein LPJ81_006655, partial [Coemansia sp. IMI 209127]